jgi:hypothetical protein
MAKKPSRKTWIKKLDTIFSQYIRQRDADKKGYCTCCTCGKKLKIKEIHCGHFMSRRHYSTRWDEENCAAQCSGCNTFNQGEQYKFALYLNNKYGGDKATELLIKSRESCKLSIVDLEEKYLHFKNLLTKA